MRACSPLRTAIALALAATAVTPLSAYAFNAYLEPGVGVSTLTNATGFFGAGTPPNIPIIGPSFGFGLFASFFDGPLDIQLGALGRQSTSSSLTATYGLQVLYPTVRIQMSVLYLSFGMSPWIWQRVGPTFAMDGYLPVTGSLAYLGELGFLYAMTPTFSVGLAAGTQWVASGGAYSPGPSIDGQFMLRFYFGSHLFHLSGSGGSAGGWKPSGEYHGWRYPFGNPNF